jgi:uncharacterized protein
MSIEVRPLGSTCNLRCEYCYEETERQAHGEYRYNRDAVLAALKNVGDSFTVFGGEPLMLPIPQLEELLMLSCRKFGRSGIQTNGGLITDAHIEMFIRCKTQIGISIDGPGELNDARWAGTINATRKQTARTEDNIKKLISRSKIYSFLMPSLIVTLHAGNVAKLAFPKFILWLRELDALGVRYINLHAMEMDYKAEKWSLPIDEYIDRFIDYCCRINNKISDSSFQKNKPVKIGGLSVTPFRKSHDAADPHSFMVSGEGIHIGIEKIRPKIS